MRYLRGLIAVGVMWAIIVVLVFFPVPVILTSIFVVIALLTIGVFLIFSGRDL